MPKGVYLRTTDPWNKGLSKSTDPRVAKAAVKLQGSIPWTKGKTKKEFPQLVNMGFQKGYTPWNKGKSSGMLGKTSWNKNKTKKTDPRIAKQALKMIGKHHTQESSDKIRNARLLQVNPMEGRQHTSETRKLQSKSRLKWIKEHPCEFEEQIRKLCRICVSKSQLRMFDIVKSYMGTGIEVFLNYRTKTSKTYRFIDVAIPSANIGFEFDGMYWHPDITKDLMRDKELTDQGWIIVHINEEGLRYIAQ